MKTGGGAQPIQESTEVSAFRFSELLKRRAESAATKGARTEMRLNAAAAEALETTPYRAFKISDVTGRAKVSYGLFYHYYPDKTKITEAVLRAFVHEAYSRYRGIHAGADFYASIHAANLYYLEIFRLNAGLMAAVFALAEEVEDFRGYWNEILHGWHERIAKTIAGQPGWTKDQAMLAAYALGGMIDQLCLQLYVNAAPGLGRPDTAAVAATLTKIWHRAVYGRDPET